MKKTTIFICVLILLLPIFVYGCNDSGQGDITSYDITCELDKNTLNGVETVNFINTSDTTIKQLKFNLFGNAFRKDAKYLPISAQYMDKAYPHGASYGDMQINDAFVEGNKANFSIGGVDKNILVIDLNREIFPDERVSVKIDFTLNLANVIARTG